MNPNPKEIRVSVVVPFLNEEPSLRPLAAGVLSVLERYHEESEVLFVDDGSADGGPGVVKDLSARDGRVKLISLRKNFGQTAAWAAGIDFASGDIILFLDADLQNDPADIPVLVEKIIVEGFDCASGWRKSRKDPFLSRVGPSRLANALISWVTGIRLHDYGCSLKAYKAGLVKNIRLYGEMHRLLPAYVAQEGARIAEVAVAHHPRRFGQSKYTIFRTFKVLLDLVTVTFLGAFSTKPLYFFGGLGGMSFLLGLLAFLVVAYRVLILERKEATPMVFMMVVLFIAAIQFVLMGLLAEIAVRIYHEAQAKPVYRVRELVNIRPVRARRRMIP